VIAIFSKPMVAILHASGSHASFDKFLGLPWWLEILA
jgi:hypothetical protein